MRHAEIRKRGCGEDQSEDGLQLTTGGVSKLAAPTKGLRFTDP